MKSVLLPALLFVATAAAGQVTIDIDDAAPALNTGLGEVIGIGVQSVIDADGPTLTQALREIDVRHVRYQSGFEDSWLFDPADPDQGIVGMKDSGFWWTGFATSNGRWNQSLTTTDFGDLLVDLNADGHAVLCIDPVNYRGTEDATLAAMDYRERVDLVKAAAVAYVTYNRDNDLGITHFEIGNEPDYAGRGALDPIWKTDVYAAVVKEIAQAIRAVDPSIKIGAHGGLQAGAASDRYLDTLLAVVKEDIDFVVSHNYAFWVGSYNTFANNCNYCSFETATNNINRGIDLYAPNEDLEISVTEWSGFQQRQPARFWHGLMTLDMIGDVVQFDRVEEMLLWTAVWLGADQSQVFKDKTSYARTPIGDAVKLFADHTQPEITGNDEVGAVEWFHTRDPATGSMTTFLVNRGTTDESVTLRIANAAAEADEHGVYLLLNDASDPEALTSSLAPGPDATWSDSPAGVRTVTLTLPAVSGAAVVFRNAGVLPAVLSSFSASRSGGDIELAWATSSEIGVDYFEPAYSTDATTWLPLTRVSARGAPATYALTHEDVPAGVRYYRLRVVDVDGGEAFSDIVVVDDSADAPRAPHPRDIVLSPNPAADVLHVGGVDHAGFAGVEAIDIVGRVYRPRFEGGRVDLSGLPTGVYALRLLRNGTPGLAAGRFVIR